MKTKKSSKLSPEGINWVRVTKLVETEAGFRTEGSIEGYETVVTREDDAPADETSEGAKFLCRLKDKRLSMDEVEQLTSKDVEGVERPMLIIHRRGTGGRAYGSIAYVFSDSELRGAVEQLNLKAGSQKASHATA